MDPELYVKRYSAAEILSLSWDLVKKNTALLLAIILSVYLPVNIIVSLIPETILAAEAFMPGFRIYAMLILAIQTLIVLIADLALVYAVKELIEGRKTDYRNALRQSLKRWPAAVGTEMIMAVFLAGLFILFIIPGIIFAVYWSFALFAVMIRNKSGTFALSYSRSLVKGRWWKVLGYSVSFGLLSFLPVIPFLVLWFMMPKDPFTDLLYSTVSNISMSFYTVAWTVYFLNLDTVKEEKKQVADERKEPVINRL